MLAVSLTGFDPFETIGLQTAPLDVRRDRESGIRSTTVEPGGSARVRSVPQADFAKCIECIFSVLLALASTALKRGTAPRPTPERLRSEGSEGVAQRRTGNLHQSCERLAQLQDQEKRT
jgi:hypothetical protein